MATRKKGGVKAKAKRRPAPVAKPAARKKAVKVAKKPAKKAPVRRAAPVKARPAARPTARPAAASPPRQPAPAKRAAASAPVQPQATWPTSASAPAQAPPAQAAPAGERVGVVTHYYGHLSVAVVRLETGRLRVGDMVLIRGHTTDFTQPVESLQIEHRPVTEVGPNDDFALKVIAHAREHDVVYRLGP